MEAYEQHTPLKDSRFFTAYNKTRSWILASLGVIFTIVGALVIFFVASLEGTKEIRASNSDSGKMLNIWREQTGSTTNEFPEEKAIIILFEGKEYYFVVESFNEETGDIQKWYFAYDGGLEYIFGDEKFYILTSLTIVISLYVANINYSTTVRSTMLTETFSKTLSHYQKKKEEIEKYTQYIPDFCAYKNIQEYELAKRDIVESAGLNYKHYSSDNFDESKLEPWQKKVLKKIKRIKVQKLKTSDLLQEHNMSFSTKIVLLPIGQKEHQKRFLIVGFVQKTITSALSGLVVAFGVILGNWILGITYGMVVFISFVASIVVATDFVSTTLRNRFLAKADLLNEFANIKEKFINEEKLPQTPVKDIIIESEETNDAKIK
jgi:hypothetical protein